MRILGLDPGISTGACLLATAPKELNSLGAVSGEICFTFSKEQFSRKEFLDLIEKSDIVVCERLPKNITQDLSLIVHDVQEKILLLDKKYELITPGAWKPVSSARKWRSRTATNQHEKDAFCIAYYWIWTNLEKFV